MKSRLLLGGRRRGAVSAAWPQCGGRVIFAGAGFEDRDDRIEGEADGAEAGQHAGRNEETGLEERLLEKEGGEEEAGEGRNDGDDRGCGGPAGSPHARSGPAG